MTLSPKAREAHEQFLIDHFSRDVHVVTEWRDGCVWKTKKVGTVVAFMDNPPFKPNSHTRLVPR